jgi:hypothetical protein
MIAGMISLQRSRVRAAASRQIIHLHDRAVFRDSVHQVRHPNGVVIALESAPQECFHDRDARLIRACREDAACNRDPIVAENVANIRDAICDGRDGSAEERIETAGRELDGEDAAFAAQEPRKLPPRDAHDPGAHMALEDQVDAGMRQDLHPFGRDSAKVPLDRPIMFDV